MSTEHIDTVLIRLDRIEAALSQILQQRTPKKWYTTSEVAQIVGKAEYTVREWCRQGRVQAEKAPNGRGWLISHEQLETIRNHGPLPIPKHEPHSLANS
jgi:excisionase family DNA binding protein